MEPEQLLLEAAKQMNEEALVKIFDLYATPLYSYTLRLVGDPLLADHIVGDVFARLLEQLAAGHGPRSNLRSYLFETAYHLIVDEARSSHRRAPLEALSSLRPDIHSAWLSVEDQIIFEGILEAIEHDLTDDQRHVILLRFLEELSLRETAAILGKEISHIKVIQNRALAKIRTVFERKEMKAARSLPRLKKMSNMLGT
jgi:RNA polymerase sigma-70 factor (ECF subfamily)